MTHRSIHSQFLASILAGLLCVPTVVVGATLLSPAVANASVTTASCQIHAIEATPEGDGTIPPEIDFLTEQLQAPEFARYRGFRFVETKIFKLEVGKDAEQKFKSGHSVKLSLLGGEKEKLELHTELLRGGTSVVKMDILLKVAQVVLIPVRRGDQATIFAYQCKG